MLYRYRIDRQDEDMELAIEATELRKTYPPDGHGARRAEPIRRGGHDLRAARPQRRRQVDDGAGARDAHASRQRQRARGAASTCSPTRSACAARSASSARSTAADPEATGRENLVLQGEFYGITGRELRRRVDALARALRAGRRRRPPGQDLLGRHAAPPRRRDGAAAPARRCCSSTSRRPGSIPRRASRCGRRSSASPPRSR